MRTSRLQWAQLFAASAVVLVMSLASSAQPSLSVGADSEALFNRIMSPFCPGLLLANCKSSAAQDLRRSIRDALSRGDTPETIEARLHERFGDRIRAMPRASGIGLLAWTIPSVLLAASAFWLLAWLRRVGANGYDAAAGLQEEPVGTELIDRLDEELARL